MTFDQAERAIESAAILFVVPDNGLPSFPRLANSIRHILADSFDGQTADETLLLIREADRLRREVA
jgi:hypothetical protein